MQAGNERSFNVQKAKDHFVRPKTERSTLSATGSRSFNALSKATSRHFCSSNFHPIHNFSRSYLFMMSHQLPIFFTVMSMMPFSIPLLPAVTRRATTDRRVLSAPFAFGLG